MSAHLYWMHDFPSGDEERSAALVEYAAEAMAAEGMPPPADWPSRPASEWALEAAMRLLRQRNHGERTVLLRLLLWCAAGSGSAAGSLLLAHEAVIEGVANRAYWGARSSWLERVSELIMRPLSSCPPVAGLSAASARYLKARVGRLPRAPQDATSQRTGFRVDGGLVPVTRNLPWLWLYPPLPPKSCLPHCRLLARAALQSAPRMPARTRDALASAVAQGRLGNAASSLAAYAAGRPNPLPQLALAMLRGAASAGDERSRVSLLVELARRWEGSEEGSRVGLLADVAATWVALPLERVLDVEGGNIMSISSREILISLQDLEAAAERGDGEDSWDVGLAAAPVPRPAKAPEASKEEGAAIVGYVLPRPNSEPRDEPEEAVPMRRASVMVREVGDPKSRDGKAISVDYGTVVGKPLLFRGELPPPGSVERALTARYPWMPGVARFVEGQLALVRSAGDDRLRLPPILLVGPPGCGKTNLSEHLCRLLSLPSLTVPVGGTSDSGGLGACPRFWNSTQPCAPVRAMRAFECANPAIILDELEKGAAPGGRNGNVVEVALGMVTGPSAYYDSCLQSSVDLGFVTWLATANSVARIPEPLLDRFTSFEVGAPAAEHFDLILAGVLADAAGRFELPPGALPDLALPEVEWLRRAWTRSGRSIRVLQRAAALVLGDIARELAAGRRLH